jgi:hypothetical protein
MFIASGGQNNTLRMDGLRMPRALFHQVKRERRLEEGIHAENYFEKDGSERSQPNPSAFAQTI